MSNRNFHYDPDKQNAMYKVLRPIAKFLVWFVFKTKVYGLENIPEKGGFILASNHITAIDPVFMVAKCPRELHFMGKAELFQKGFTRWFLTGMNGFPVQRRGVDMKAMRYAQALLKKDHVLGIFPEGTRSKTCVPQSPKAGVALIAKETQSDVVPVSIYFSEKPHWRSRLTIRFGEVIPFEQLGITSEEHDSQQLRDAAKLIMERITEQWAKKHDA